MKNRLIFFFCLLVLLNYRSTSGQTYYKLYKEVLRENNSNLLTNKVDSLMTLSLENNDLFSYREIAHRYSIYLAQRRKFKQALNYILLEIENFEKNKIFSNKYTNALYVTGRHYSDNFQYEKAISYYEKVIELNNIIVRTGQAYVEIGANYSLRGKLREALFFFDKGLVILEKEKEYDKLVNHLLRKSDLYETMGGNEKLDKSYECLKKAEELSKSNNIRESTSIALSDALATYYTFNSRFNFEKSKYYYNNNLRIGFKYGDSTTIVATYNNLAYLFNIEKRDSAKFFIDEGLKYANYPEVKASLYDNLTDYQIRKNQPQKALESIQRSIEIILNSKIEDTPTSYQLDEAILKDYILYYLKKRSEIYIRLSQRDKNKEDLRSAIKNIESAEYVVSLLLNETSEALTQLIWRREASQAYLYGAYAAHLLGDKEQAFSFMEKNKALLLSESILKNTEFANLPKHVSDEETRLQKLMYELENELSKNESNAVLQDSLFNAKRQHEKYVDSLKIVYPKYFDRKIDVTQVPLSKVKEELKKDQILVSYIWNKFDEETELLIGLATSKEKTITFEINQTDSLKKKIARYRALISKPQSTKEGQEAYQEVAYELFQSLFPSQEIKNLIKGKNLVIIPDGDLQNIPFEALITKENSNDYFILNGDISYSYSYSFLKHNAKVKRETNQSFIGYSPVSFKEEGLSSLNDSEKEVETITKELGGVLKLNQAASKEDFLAQSSQSKIIHLATHADAGENPWIAFSDGKLELHELYTYKNNAELVTLSACNTSLGEMAKGEGVLSLARGFFYSGSKSVVSSLWNVNDTSTSDIMTNFYKNLKDGQTKSEALNNAKRTYLTTHELSAQSPYYWSSFVLIGDAEAIYGSHNYWLYALVIIGFLALFVFFRKKRIS